MSELFRCFLSGCNVKCDNPDAFRTHINVHVNKRIAKWESGKAKIELPKENWLDVFAFLRRKCLVQIDGELGRKFFKSIVHHRLHKQKWCRSSRFGYRNCKKEERVIAQLWYTNSGMCIGENEPDHGYYFGDYDYPEGVPVPDIELSESFDSFERIVIRRVDDKLLNFLRMMKRLLTDVQLVCPDPEERDVSQQCLLHILGKIVPLCISFRSLSLPCVEKQLPMFIKHFASIIPSLSILRVQFDATQLGTLEIFTHVYNWLEKPRRDGSGKPKLLVVYLKAEKGRQRDAYLQCFSKFIQQRFLAAKSPSISFVVQIVAEVYFRWEYRPPYYGVEYSEAQEPNTLNNRLTDEQLILRKFPPRSGAYDEDKLIISRASRAIVQRGEWLKIERELLKWDYNEKELRLQQHRDYRICKKLHDEDALSEGVEEDEDEKREEEEYTIKEVNALKWINRNKIKAKKRNGIWTRMRLKKMSHRCTRKAERVKPMKQKWKAEYLDLSDC